MMMDCPTKMIDCLPCSKIIMSSIKFLDDIINDSFALSPYHTNKLSANCHCLHSTPTNNMSSWDCVVVMT